MRTKPSPEGYTLVAARKYVARGLHVVPIAKGENAPTLPGWQKLRLSDVDLPPHFDANNVGVLNGAPSAGIVDVDLDAAEALAVADLFLPATALAFGRQSKARSHRIYQCDAVPVTVQFRADDKTMLVELRSTGTQTIWPPSTHPSGEAIRFDAGGEPAKVDAEELRRACALMAATALLARHWPKQPGSRHHLANAAGGFLIRRGLDETTAAKLIEAAARVAGDEEWRERRVAVQATAKSLRAGKHVTGGPTLIDLLGEKVVAKLGEWLGVTSARADAGAYADERVTGDGARMDEDGGGNRRERFRLLDDEEILQTPDVRPLVEGRLSLGEIAVAHGDSGAHKTFLAVDLSFHVATGLPWHGHVVHRGPVVYIAAEGQDGMKRRVLAWKIRHQRLGKLGVHFLYEPVDPLSAADINALVARLRQLPERPVLVVVDTWSLSLAAGVGDEDKNRDVTKAMGAWRRVIAELGCTVLVIHHEGHAEKSRARGGASLQNNADVRIAMSFDKKTGIITVRNPKQRDIDTFEDFYLKRAIVELPDGMMPSCVLEPASAPAGASKDTGDDLPAKAAAALRVLPEAGATFGQWRALTGLAETTFRRVREMLLQGGYVTKPADEERGVYTLTDEGRAYRQDRQKTASGGDGCDQDHSRQQPPPYRGGCGGCNGGADETNPGPAEGAAPDGIRIETRDEGGRGVGSGVPLRSASPSTSHEHWCPYCRGTFRCPTAGCAEQQVYPHVHCRLDAQARRRAAGGR